MLCPDLPEHEALNGQLLEVEVSALTDTIGDMKVRPPKPLTLNPEP